MILAVSLSNLGSVGRRPFASTTLFKTLCVKIAISSELAPDGIISAIHGPKYLSTNARGSPAAPPPPSVIAFTSTSSMISEKFV